MNTNEKLITDFYTAFQNKDWKGMQACYHYDIVFNDPVFENLKGGEAKAMWHMLIGSSKELTLQFNAINANDHSGVAHWEAFYPFSQTGRKVHNIIDAQFKFKDTKIIRHTDHFNFWRWSRMALGTSGLLLGWTPLINKKIKSIARAGLDKFLKEHEEYAA